jgi:FtsP/CotA-like multicopper oxidase with cupredoxin domain
MLLECTPDADPWFQRLFLGMRTKTFILALLALSVASCKGNEPKAATYNLCVHPSGTVFVPGTTGAQCKPTQTLQKGQSTTLLIDADNYTGAPRTASISLPFGLPSGWTGSLGGTTIDIPGQQTLTITVPQNAASGDYPLLVRAISGTETVELRFDVRLAGGNPI